MLLRTAALQAPPTQPGAEGALGPRTCVPKHPRAITSMHRRQRQGQVQHAWQRQCAGRRCPAVAAAAAASAATPGAGPSAASYDALVRWCIEQHALPPLAVEPAPVEAAGGEARTGFVATRDVAAGEVVLQIPGDLAITSVDVEKDDALAAVAAGRSELVGLALWLMQERAKVRTEGSSSSSELGRLLALHRSVQRHGMAAGMLGQAWSPADRGMNL